MLLSIIIPCYNEEKNVHILHGEILSVCRKNNLDCEIIFIDDGSTDHTYDELKKIANVTIIKLRKNFGQTSAMDAGFKIAQGDIIVTMDGDLQNDPADIPKLLQKIKEKDLDIVSGWRIKRNDSFSKKILSRGANLLRKIVINDGINDSGCTLKAYKKECLKNLNLYGETHRFIPAILKWQGFKVGEIEVNHRSRQNGQTKYNWKRTIKGTLDLMNVWFWKKYSTRPLHFFGSIGILFTVSGFITGIYVLYLKIFQDVDLSDTALTLLATFLFLSGLNFLTVGILSDIMMKNYYQKGSDKPYSIKKIIKTHHADTNS